MRLRSPFLVFLPEQRGLAWRGRRPSPRRPAPSSWPCSECRDTAPSGGARWRSIFSGEREQELFGKQSMICYTIQDISVTVTQQQVTYCWRWHFSESPFLLIKWSNTVTQYKAYWLKWHYFKFQMVSLLSLYPICQGSVWLSKVNSAIRNYPSKLPLNTEGGQVQDRADDGDGLHVVEELARRHPKGPRVGEQFGHLKLTM